MTTATITSKGQITIPRSVRLRLGLKAGDQLAFSIENDGAVRLRPRNVKAADVVGMLAKYSTRKKPATIEEMNAGIAEAVRVRWERKQKGR